jgi:hypothetical protein
VDFQGGNDGREEFVRLVQIPGQGAKEARSSPAKSNPARRAGAQSQISPATALWSAARWYQISFRVRWEVHP